MLDESGNIPTHVVEELRLMADKAKACGRFDAGVRLHALLDAVEEREDCQTEIEDLRGYKEQFDDAEKKLTEIGPARRELDAAEDQLRDLKGALQDAEGLDPKVLKDLVERVESIQTNVSRADEKLAEIEP